MVSVITFLGQLQLYRRIKEIIDRSLGQQDKKPKWLTSPSVMPETEDNGEPVPAPTPSLFVRFLQKLRSLRIFGKLFEIAVILQQLDWLEGKVKIVAAFVPVVAKLVCRQGVSDEKVLESKLARRMGCYMFVDIAGYFIRTMNVSLPGFTPLCEKVSPDTAGKVLEVFYSVVETAALAEKHDILVKRLGDGLFLTWGFKLAVRCLC